MVFAFARTVRPASFDPRGVESAESCTDMVRCMFNLTELDMLVLGHLFREGSAKADDLAAMLDRDRSTVYRSLQKLVSCQLAVKEARSLERGGYFHVYSPVPRDLVRGRLEGCIEAWHARMLSMLERFDGDMDGL